MRFPGETQTKGGIKNLLVCRLVKKAVELLKRSPGDYASEENIDELEHVESTCGSSF